MLAPEKDSGAVHQESSLPNRPVVVLTIPFHSLSLVTSCLTKNALPLSF